MSNLLRRAHFLGAKLRSLRKRHGWTLEEVSTRCSRVESAAAPSVSYLSMIETGKRMPSPRLLEVLAEVFQKPAAWFLDEHADEERAAGHGAPRREESATATLDLEPRALFSEAQLRHAIPELLSQTGTTGYQFAQLLIRTYQETQHNNLPDLERAAEAVGGKRLAMTFEDLCELAGRVGLDVRWFDREAFPTQDDASGIGRHTLVRSFFDAPSTVYLNRQLAREPSRLKYDLATHIGHKVLHGGDGKRSFLTTGGWGGGSPSQDAYGIASEEVLFAWRDFECGFFADALLCPRLPYRDFLFRHGYDVRVGVERLDLTLSVLMRRATAVSPYRHWHYLDAYDRGQLRHVYRGNGIALPWGNMRMVPNPCRQWAVFRVLARGERSPFAQISIMEQDNERRLYACETHTSSDAAGNRHIICMGVDLAPVLETQYGEAAPIVDRIADACHAAGGESEVPRDAAEHIERAARLLNIGWIVTGLGRPANVICARNTRCPRSGPCEGRRPPQPRPVLDRVREEILREAAGGEAAGA
jgi:transcriptional regulator with XRE-family HTH domain